MRRWCYVVLATAALGSVAAAQTQVFVSDPPGRMLKKDRWLWPLVQPIFQHFPEWVDYQPRGGAQFWRYEMACAAYRAQLVARSDAGLRGGAIPLANDEKLSLSDRPEKDRLAFWAANYRNVAFLLTEFRPELTSMEVPWPALASDIHSVEVALRAKGVALKPARFGPFRDVPPNHWAAKAVGELRRLGILNGYLDSRFRG